MTPQQPVDEAKRLEVLRNYAILDSAPEVAFERITRLAARLFDVPVAAISLIDAERQWFKSCYGLDSEQMAREDAFCAHTILHTEVMVVSDAPLDARFAANPLVVGFPHIRFYAGAPLIAPEGQNLGALAILDTEPREFSESEKATLTDLAAQVMDGIEMRRIALELRAENLERQRAEAELQRKSYELTDFVENAAVGLHWVAADGSIIWVNQAELDMLGYTREEYVGRSIADFHADTEVSQDILQRLHNNETLDSYEARIVCKDGSLKHVSISSNVLFENGQFIHTRCFTRDITARKAAEAELQQREREWRTLAENAPDIITRLDRDLRHLFVSPEIERVTGMPPAAFIGKTNREMGMPEDLVAQWDSRLRSVFATGQPAFYEFEFPGVHGRRLYFEGKSVPELGVNGTVETVLSIARDITIRKEAEAGLRESERRNHLLVEGTKDYAMFLMDTDRNIVHWNAGAERITGYDKSEVLGRSADIIFTGEDREHGVPEQETRQAVEQVRVDSKRWHVRKDGTRFWADGVLTALYDESGKLQGFAQIMRDASKEQLAEMLLRGVEERYRLLAEYTLDLISLLDLQGGVLYASPSHYQVLGYEVPEIIDQNISTVIHIEDVAASESAMERLLESGQSQTVELRVVHKNGIWRDFECLLSLIPGDIENRILLSARDITQRKRFEAELKQNERELRSLAENLPDIVCRFDRHLRLSFVSKAVERLMGMPVAAIMGRTHTHMPISPELAAIRAQQVRQVLETGQSSLDEYEFLRADGVTLDFEARTVPEFDEGGAVASVLTITRDITEHKRIEAELHERQETLQAILRASPDVISFVGADGIIQWTSGAISHFIGDDAQALASLSLAQALQMAVHPDDQEATGQQIQALLAGELEEARIRFRMMSTSGRVMMTESNIHLVRDEAGRILGLVSVMRDVTEQAQLEGRIQAAKSEAERANRAKSEFLSRMSHELRTPMNAILGFGQLLEMDEPSAEHTRYVEQILKGGRHLLELINEVLDISRIDAGQISISVEPVQLSRVVLEAWSLVQPLAEQRHVQPRGEWGQNCDYTVLADQQRLKQVILNLLSNAIKYNHEGGVVNVSCEERGDSILRLTVTDNGPGIAPENLEKLFLPFERLGAENSGVEGTGIGMALSKQLMQLMGGDIGVQSTLEEGSRFWIELPLGEPPDSPSQDIAVDSPADSTIDHQRATHTILYIEDNLSNLRLVEGILLRQPHLKLIAAMQGGLGLELARQHRPDLILLDLHLPDISGDQVLQHLRGATETYNIPVIMLSADATPRQIERLLEAGADEYLTKPLDVKRFLEVVENLLNKTLEQGTL